MANKSCVATVFNKEGGMAFKWNPDDRYTGNSGHSEARVLDANDKLVTIEHWNVRTKNPKRKTCQLSLAYFTSDRCAWKIIRHHQ